MVITTHDALSYFARDYGLRVKTLQGASTVSEFGLREITDLVDLSLSRRFLLSFLKTSLVLRLWRVFKEVVRQRGLKLKLDPNY